MWVHMYVFYKYLFTNALTSSNDYVYFNLTFYFKYEEAMRRKNGEKKMIMEGKRRCDSVYISLFFKPFSYFFIINKLISIRCHPLMVKLK